MLIFSNYNSLQNNNVKRTNLAFKANVPKVTKEQINKLKQEGKSPKDICDELKISKSTYGRILNKAK